jgi:hypothetical protein
MKAPPPPTVIRFANLLALVFLGKSKVRYFLNRVVYLQVMIMHIIVDRNAGAGSLYLQFSFLIYGTIGIVKYSHI